MDVERAYLEDCIDRTLSRTRFRNAWGQRFGPSTMHEFYIGKRHGKYRVNGAKSVAVSEKKPAGIFASIAPLLAPYRASDSGAAGNGLYRLKGGLASPDRR